MEGRLPFTVEDATRPETETETTDDVQYKRVLLDTRLNNRIIDLRVRPSLHTLRYVLQLIRYDNQTTTNQAVFKLQHGISSFFRQYLEAQGFVEIHSPKLQGAATESGASVFKVNYFKGKCIRMSCSKYQLMSDA